MKFRLLVFSALLLVFSCGKEETNPDRIIQPEDYATTIQQHTDIVLEVMSNETLTLAEGLKETQVRYLDTLGRPIALFFLTVDLTNPKLRVEASSAADGEDLNAKETVRNQLRYNNTETRDVLAAVNGDYWRINANEEDLTPMGQPYGLVYMKGERYKDITRGGRYYFFTMLDTREVVIGDKSDYGRFYQFMEEALGGRYLLVQDGREMPDELGLNTNVEPRTTVGVVNPERVVFMVVDGRRADHSQGLRMRDLAKLHRAIGVQDAINLDGGGSSTFVVKQGEQYQVRNRPSDGSERRVANAWTITLER